MLYSRLMQKGASTVYARSAPIRNCYMLSRKGALSKENTFLYLKQSFQFQPSTSINIKGCGFHTSQRRSVNPVLWILLKPMFKISAALTGRGVRKWYRRMDPKERKSFWRESRFILAGAACSVVGFFTYYYLSHIQETPITGRKRFMALTHDQILSVSQSQAESLLEQNKDKLHTNQSIEAHRVMDVATRLLNANPELRKMSFDSWQIFVVQDPTINAFVLPTGHVFVCDGMLDFARTQDELAIILGHEMAHALLEHGVEEISYGQFIDYIIIVLMAALWCIIPSDGIALVTQWFHNKMIKILTRLPHSRAVEEEADRVGAMLAAKACFDIRQGVVLWEKMEANNTLGGAEDIPTFLSTHPHNLKRANFFEYIIPQAEKWRDEMKCPLWPKRDPRQAIEIISKIVDNHVAARKSGQNLARVKMTASPGAKTAMADSQTSNSSGDHSFKISGVNVDNVEMPKKTDLSNGGMKNQTLDMKESSESVYYVSSVKDTS